MDRKEAIISRLLTEQYAYFYRIAYSYVGREADALDIVQESAYKAIYHSNKLKQPEYAQTWITRIVINEALSFLRKHKRELLPIEEELEAVAEEAAVSREEAVDLREAIQKLPPEEKTLIILRFFEDKKLEEIAAICGEGLSAVKSRLYRTLKKLKLELETED